LASYQAEEETEGPGEEGENSQEESKKKNQERGKKGKSSAGSDVRMERQGKTKKEKNDAQNFLIPNQSS